MRPNIVFFCTDDQDLDTFALVPGIEELLGAAGGGVTFENGAVTTPLCCPSRVSQFRGQLTHSHKVLDNKEPNGGVQRFNELGYGQNNVMNRLGLAGYRIALVGKYMNGYDGGYVPGPIDRFFGQTGAYQDPPPLKFYENVGMGRPDSRWYANDPRNYPDAYLLRDAAVREVELWRRDQPMYLQVGFLGPHHPAYYDGADEDAFPGLKAPRKPNWGATDADDPRYVREEAPWTEAEASEADLLFRKKARNMLAVERAVRAIVEAFYAAGQGENTYFFFTSDNGYKHGEHGMNPGKRTPYREDVRVPFLARGPGIVGGARLPHFALNIDLAPTFCEIAGAEPAFNYDGRSLMPVLRGEGVPWRKRHLIEYSVEAGVPSWSGVVTPTESYREFSTGEREHYSYPDDPFELNNLVDDGADHSHLKAHLDAMRRASGEAYRAAEEA